MANVAWEGIYPALITPFTENDELDIPLFEHSLDEQLAAGIHGIVIAGSLGEASTLKPKEKEILVKTAMKKINGKIPVILNIAESSTQQAIEQAKMAATWGVDGLMLLPPMRYKADDRETVEYFKAVANSTSLPIMIYNNPVDYKVEVTLDMFDELSRYKNIAAIKESTRDVTNVTRLTNRFAGRFKILCGVDTLAMEELILGADGWVAGLVCAFPKETVAIFNLVRQGKIDEARKIYRWFMPLLELDIHPKLVHYIKLAAAKTGLGSEYVRSPRLKLEGKERERILNIIEVGLKNRPSL